MSDTGARSPDPAISTQSPLDVLRTREGLGTAAAALGLYALIAALTAKAGTAHGAIWYAVTATLALLLAALTAIDLRTYRLPNTLTYLLIAAGLALALVFPMPDVTWRALSAVGGFAVLAAVAALYRHLRHRDGLGLGDAKLFAAAGAWVGAERLPDVLLIASGSALLVALAGAIRTGRLDPGRRLAFGPFLALGLWLVWLRT